MRSVTASLIGLLAAAALLLPATPLLAQEPETTAPAPQEQQEREHVVRPGDTLLELAAHYYGDSSRWRLIYEANRSVLQNPDAIEPGQVLVLPGNPRAERPAQPARAERPVRRDDPRLLGVPLEPDDAAAADRPRPAAADQDRRARRADEPLRTVFYTPRPGQPEPGEPATVLSEPEDRLVPVRPGEFISAAYLADPATLPVRATFLRPIRDDRPGRGARATAHPRDRVYLSYGPRERPAVDDRLVLVAVGRSIDGAPLAQRVIDPRGIVRIVDLGAEVIEAQIEEQYGPVFPGQAVIVIPAFPEFEVERARPVEGGYDVEGEILEFLDDQPLQGPAALAFIDLGRRDGVREGDIFQAYLPTREGRSGSVRGTGTLPTEVVAELRVVRVTDTIATVRVDHVRLARLEEGLPVVRIRRIP